MMANPFSIDLVAKDPKRRKLLLIITEHRRWGGKRMQKQFRTKAEAYANYVLSEEFRREYPQLSPNDVVVKLDCAYPPDRETCAIFKDTEAALQEHGMGFEYEVWE